MTLEGQPLGDDYILEEMIGEGGMAVVYRASQKSLNRSVAVKILYYQEDNSLARFEREAKAIASLRHRNILIIYEYGEQDDMPYIVMEHVAGGTLEDRLTGAPLAWQQVVELSIPIAKALHYAHQHGIIHRDIKPSNVLMPQDDWPVLADFGLVKPAGEEQGLTMSGTFMGTPSYIAPEQARDIEVDFRADMYSLGVMMFEMATGRLPFDYENPNKILLSHVMEPPPHPQDINPDCPSSLATIILKTLSKAAEDRYADMQALIEALNQVQPDAPSSTPSPKAAPQKAAAAQDPAPEKASQEKGGFFSSVKKFFGRKKSQERKNEKKADTARKTAPQPHVTLSADFDEGGTIQLNLGAKLGPKLVLKEQNVTLDLPHKDVLVLGRTYRENVVDIDLEPHEASKYGVSRRHARLLKQGDWWLLEDLGSLNGTFVNDLEVRQGNPVVLKDSDTLRLSHMVIIFIQV